VQSKGTDLHRRARRDHVETESAGAHPESADDDRRLNIRPQRAQSLQIAQEFPFVMASQPHSGTPAPDSDPALTRSLHGYRERLLDATRRNALINYPLDQHRRSKRFVRVVDELPDFLAERLFGSGGRPLGFRGLERDDTDTPVEEKTAEFRNALAEARATDPDHLEALRMPAPAVSADEALARIERALRSRVRQRLGLGAVDLERKLTPEQAALALGIRPDFDLPRASIVLRRHPKPFTGEVLRLVASGRSRWVVERTLPGERRAQWRGPTGQPRA